MLDDTRRFCPECGRGPAASRATYCAFDGRRLEMVESPAHERYGAIVDRRFRLLEKIGGGSGASVYRALQIGGGQQVALKVLEGDLDWEDTSNQRFLRESKATSRLMHPNIVRPIEFGRDPESKDVYFVMEWVAGDELRRILDRGALAIERALSIVVQLCGALYEAHRHGIVHRDLKPENIKLQSFEDGTVWVKVLDFGVAKTIQDDHTLTRSSVVVGTPGYMAPEQATPEATVDGRTDLYALGVVLFEMLTGSLPFDHPNPVNLMKMHLEQTPPDPRALSPTGGDVPEDVVELLREMLAKDLEARPDDALALRGHIERIRHLHGFDDPFR